MTAASHAQTNLRSVMVGTNNAVERPTNFWSANASAINSVVADEVFTKSRFVTTFAGAQTTLTNVIAANEPAWFHMYSTETNATASGQAMLMRYVLASEATGGGFQFQNKNYRLIVDTLVSVVSTNNVARFTIGNAFVDGGPLTGSGVGFEVRTRSGNADIRAIARNGTNAQVASEWINTGTTDRLVVIVESRTNGQVNLLTAKGIVGDLPTLRTNISGGPTNTINAVNANLNVGLFVNETNSVSRYLSIYGAAVQIVD